MNKGIITSFCHCMLIDSEYYDILYTQLSRYLNTYYGKKVFLRDISYIDSCIFSFKSERILFMFALKCETANSSKIGDECSSKFIRVKCLVTYDDDDIRLKYYDMQVVRTVRLFNFYQQPSGYGDADDDEINREAERLIRKYCPDARIDTAKVSIKEIAEGAKLTIVESIALAEGEASVKLHFLGQNVQVQKKRKKFIESLYVRNGTLVVNVGKGDDFLKRYLISNAVVNWDNFRIKYMLREKMCRILKLPVSELECFDNEYERQWVAYSRRVANAMITPRGSMDRMIRMLFAKYNYRLEKEKWRITLRRVIRELAGMFDVSDCVIKDRMVELGYSEVSELENPSSRFENSI